MEIPLVTVQTLAQEMAQIQALVTAPLETEAEMVALVTTAETVQMATDQTVVLATELVENQVMGKSMTGMIT